MARRIGLVILLLTFGVSPTALAQAARPDLQIANLYLAKWSAPPVTEYHPITGSILSGTKVFLVCEVRNGGPGKVIGNYAVSFRVDGAEVGSQQIENAPDPGLLRKPGTAWTAQGTGSHTFTCVVDPFPSRQVETNEGNNERSMTFKVLLPAIRTLAIPAPK